MIPTEPSTLRKLFDDDCVFHITEPGAAVLLREDGPHVTELAEFFDDFERERLIFIPLHDMRRDLCRGKVAHGPAQLNLFWGVVELHGR